MKLTQFRYFLAVVAIFLLAILFIYYNNYYEDIFNQSVYTNKTVETLKTEDIYNNSLGRFKRFLIFQGGGIVKFVIGASFPIILPDKKRSLNQFSNFQMQYVPPPIPVYWWSVYNTSTFAARKQRSTDMLMHYDNSRAFIYKLIETILQRSGNSGNECLLKVICEVARAPLSEDLHETERAIQNKDGYEDESETENVEDYGRNIFHKLINAIFTPIYSNVEERYINARAAGINGANCEETFGKCYIVDDWLRRFMRFIK